MSKRKQISTENKPILIATAILLLIFIFPVFLSYTNFYPPLIAKKTIFILDSVVADIPLLPKTPKQVVSKALIRNQNLQNYSLTSTLDVGSQQVDLLSFKVTQEVQNAGSVETKTKAKIVGKESFSSGSKTEIETAKSQNQINFKITSLPVIGGIDVANLQKDWYQIDLNSFQQALSVSARSDQQIIDDVRSQFEKSQNNLIDQGLFNKVKNFKKTKIDKESFYQVSFSLDQDSFAEIPLLSELKIADPVLTLWINSNSYYLTKIDLVGNLISKQTGSASKQNDLKIHFTSFLADIGSKQTINLPNNPTVIKNPIDFALKLTKNSDDASSLFTATASQKDLGENFLTLERLISVLLLLPKAI